MRRERDDESGDPRHDGPSQRHGRCGNTGRIASVAIRLLSGKLAYTPWHKAIGGRQRLGRANSKMLFIKCYLMVRPIHPAYFLASGLPRLPPEACSDGLRADGAGHVLCPR
jgi:hypothetical protein